MPSTISIAAIARRQRPLSVAELVELSRDPAKIQAIETAFNDRLSACQEAEKRLSAQHTSDVAEFESREVKLAEAQTALNSAHGLLDAREATLDAREANIAERAAAQNVVAQNLARREDEVAKREAALDQRDMRYRELVAVLQPSQSTTRGTRRSVCADVMPPKFAVAVGPVRVPGAHIFLENV